MPSIYLQFDFSDQNWRSVRANMKKQLGLEFKNDGEFYMSFQDFVIHFGDLEICHLTPENIFTREIRNDFQRFTSYGAWRKGITAGGCGKTWRGNFNCDMLT